MARPAASIFPLSYSPLSDLRAQAYAPKRVSVTFVTFRRPSPPHGCANCAQRNRRPPRQRRTKRP